MKVLLIILIAMQMAVDIRNGIKMHKKDGKFKHLAAAALSASVWIAPLVWLINL